jgi:hypothetical protein
MLCREFIDLIAPTLIDGCLRFEGRKSFSTRAARAWKLPNFGFPCSGDFIGGTGREWLYGLDESRGAF